MKKINMHLLFLIFALFNAIKPSFQCKFDSPYFVKEFLDLKPGKFSISKTTKLSKEIPCMYSGLIEIQPGNKIHFILIKSNLSMHIKTEQSKNLLIWLEEPGKSFFNLMLNYASPFKLNENILEYDETYSTIIENDVLFVDFPGVGYSSKINFSNIEEIVLGFNSFFKKFLALNLTSNSSETENDIKFLGYNYLSQFYAENLNSDKEVLRKINKIGIIDTGNIREDYLQGLGILSKKESSEIHFLQYQCNFNKNKFKDYSYCDKLDLYVDVISGNIDLNDTRSSVYITNSNLLHNNEIMINILNKELTKTQLNIDKDLSFVNFDREVHRSILIKKKFLFNPTSYHLYLLSGQFNLKNLSFKDLEIYDPTFSNLQIGLYKISSDNYRDFYSYFPHSTNMIKGYVKQKENVSFILFKDVGKYMAVDDKIAFDYFLHNQFFTNKKIVNTIKISDSPKDAEEKNMIKSEFIDCPDNTFFDNFKPDPKISDKDLHHSSSDQLHFDNTNEKTLKQYGGCSTSIAVCKTLNNCSGNGICQSGICVCNSGYYGVDCTLQIKPLNKFTKQVIQPRGIEIFSPQNSMDFIISDNLLLEIESTSKNVVVSILLKKDINSIFNREKHIYFQRLANSSTVLYVDKDKVSEIVVVISNEDYVYSTVNFNLFNFNTRASEFFGPGGLGFVISIIVFCIGIALYVIISLLYKDFSLTVDDAYHSFADIYRKKVSTIVTSNVTAQQHKNDFSEIKPSKYDRIGSEIKLNKEENLFDGKHLEPPKESKWERYSSKIKGKITNFNDYLRSTFSSQNADSDKYVGSGIDLMDQKK